jgi:hypothetical protein
VHLLLWDPVVSVHLLLWDPVVSVHRHSQHNNGRSP